MMAHASTPGQSAKTLPTRWARKRAKMSTTQQPKKPFAQPSPKLAALLAKLTPAEREQAIKMAAALLNKRAEREAKGNGVVDLTVKP